MTQHRCRTRLSPSAIQQIVDPADYYRLHSGPELSTRWRLAVKNSVLSLRLMPDRRSRCNFKDAALEDVRRLEISGFPRFSLFYRSEQQSRIIYILDILHEARDVEKLLSSRPDPSGSR